MTTSQPESADTPSTKNDTKPELSDTLVTTQHSVTINGERIDYTVTCGTIVLREESEKDGANEGDKPRAKVFFVAYTRDGVDNKSKRPITFSFNGGPGSSSVWLHMGVLGPRRVDMGDAGALKPPPFGYVENEFSLLDVTDLVFIDPVGTGFSRAVEGEKAKPFHTFKKDIESVGDFIRLITTRSGRWLSPKFLIGESYGTTRAAGLSTYLQERHGMYLNGIMLVSSVLDWNTIEFTVYNDLPYVLYVPTYTATAWYHQQLEPALQRDLRATLREAEAFAVGEYATALMKGARLSADERAAVAKKLARFTGLSQDFVQRANLRIEIMRFCKELLRAKHQTVGRLDSRFIGRDRDAAGETFSFDPSYSAIVGPYAAALNDYVRRALKFESDLPYELINGTVSQQWTFEHDNQMVSVSDTLRNAIANNPYLRVFVANGYFDLATPYFATEYTFDHLHIDDDARRNISMAHYEAGHMMYVHAPSLAQLKHDLAAFVQR